MAPLGLKLPTPICAHGVIILPATPVFNSIVVLLLRLAVFLIAEIPAHPSYCCIAICALFLEGSTLQSYAILDWNYLGVRSRLSNRILPSVQSHHEEVPFVTIYPKRDAKVLLSRHLVYSMPPASEFSGLLGQLNFNKQILNCCKFLFTQNL